MSIQTCCSTETWTFCLFAHSFYTDHQVHLHCLQNSLLATSNFKYLNSKVDSLGIGIRWQVSPGFSALLMRTLLVIYCKGVNVCTKTTFGDLLSKDPTLVNGHQSVEDCISAYRPLAISTHYSISPTVAAIYVLANLLVCLLPKLSASIGCFSFWFATPGDWNTM